MARVVCEFSIDNAAFDELPTVQIAQVLRDAAKKVEDCGTTAFNYPLFDYNGNRIGYVTTKNN